MQRSGWPPGGAKIGVSKWHSAAALGHYNGDQLASGLASDTLLTGAPAAHFSLYPLPRLLRFIQLRLGPGAWLAVGMPLMPDVGLK